MKNKNKTALLTFVTLVAGILFFTSCIDDFLTRQPMSLISESNVWGNGGDKKAIMALITNNYDCIPFNCGSEVGPWGDHLSQLCDESMRGYVWGNMYTPTMTSATNEKFSAWNYNRVRDINDFLERILETDIEDQDRYVAEAYFIRAFHYFDFAKRYGGVPIIDHTQAYDPNDFEALKVPRSTEEEVWNFIAQDVDLAIAHFDKCKTEAEPYRVNKYAALALKSRAMLYAATIAKYGTVQLNGLVGVPSARAQQFFELSLAASDEIIRDGKYALYDRGGDTPEGKANNFQQLFLDNTMHEEAIVLKYFTGPKFGSFDYFNAAPSFKVNWGAATNPTLEMVEAFEYIDGTPGTLPVYDETGTPIRYDNPEDLFAGKDPRFFATILYPGCPWQGNTVEIRQGILQANGQRMTATSFGQQRPDGQGAICGKDGMISSADCTETGFYIKKFMDPVNKLDYERSETPQLAMRYAEVLLNYAEAAVELDVQPAKALDCINQIRKRAGIKEKTALTLEDVRHERFVELAFENHRFWDIRRWRTATTLMNNTIFHGLFPWLDVETNEYFFETGNAARNQAKTFLERDYYFSIPGIDSNEKLVQNPGY